MTGRAVIAWRIVTGLLVDRFWAPGVACAVLALSAASCLLLAFALGGVPGAVVAAVLLGLAAGDEFDLLAYFVSRYFGTRHYGVLSACQYAIFRVALGAGPLLYGFGFDRRGSYTAVLIVAAVLLPLGSLLLLTLGAYPAAVERPAVVRNEEPAVSRVSDSLGIARRVCDNAQADVASRGYRADHVPRQTRVRPGAVTTALRFVKWGGSHDSVRADGG